MHSTDVYIAFSPTIERISISLSRFLVSSAYIQQFSFSSASSGDQSLIHYLPRRSRLRALLIFIFSRGWRTIMLIVSAHENQSAASPCIYFHEDRRPPRRHISYSDSKARKLFMYFLGTFRNPLFVCLRGVIRSNNTKALVPLAERGRLYIASAAFHLADRGAQTHH